MNKKVLARLVTSDGLDKWSADIRVTSQRKIKISKLENAISRSGNSKTKSTNEQDRKN